MKCHKLSLIITCSIFLWFAASFPAPHLPSINPWGSTESNAALIQVYPKMTLSQFVAGGFRDLINLPSSDSLQLLRSTIDFKGNKHALLQQMHHGIPIFGAWLNIHERNGEITTARGQIFRALNSEITRKLSEAEALQVAIRAFPAEQYAWQDAHFEQALQLQEKDTKASFFPQGSLVWIPEDSSHIFPTSSSNSKKEARFRLAWMFDIFAIEPNLKKAQIFIDATNGKVLHQLPNLAYCHVPAKGKAAYVPELVDIGTDSCQGLPTQRYTLSDNTRNIQIFDSKNSNGTPQIRFRHDQTQWLPPEADTVAIAAMHGLTIWYDYMLDNFGWQGLDGTGERPIQAWVHYRNNFENAVYSGFLLFGDGNPNGRWKSPMVDRTIIAHEATHGLLQHSSRLLYIAESGIINEGISDIYACLVDLDQGNGNWILGENILTGGVRRLDAPNLLGLPDTYQGDFWREPFGPNHLHHNSTILGFWAHLLSVSGNGTNDHNTQYNVFAIGRQRLSELLFHTIRFYLNPNDGFFDMRNATMEAASDLNWSQAEVENLAMAWCAIGIGGCNTTGNESLTLLSPNGGEVYSTGDEIELEWESSLGVTHIKVLISFNDGANWQELRSFPVIGTSGSINLNVPDVNSRLCRIRIVAGNDPLAFDASDEVFSIIGCDLLASFTTSLESGCSDAIFTIRNTSHIPSAVFHWEIDGNEFVADPSGFTLENLEPGTHTIKLIAQEGNCQDTSQQMIEVAPIPNANFSFTQSNLVLTTAAQFSFGEQYLWSIEGQEITNTTNGQSVTWTAPSSGAYEVCLYIEDHCSANGISHCETIVFEDVEECLGTSENWTQYNNLSEIIDMADYGDKLVLATTGGLVIYDKNSQQVEDVFNTSTHPALPCQSLGSVAVDTENNWIYAAIAPDQGFIKLDLNDRTITHFTTWTLPELLSNEITIFRLDPAGNLWVGTADQGIWVGKPGISFHGLFFNELPDKRIVDIDFSSETKTWIAMETALAKVENGVIGQIYDQEDIPNLNNSTLSIKTIMADGQKLWVGTGKGLYLMENDSWDLFNTEDYNYNSEYIKDIDKTEDGMIIFALATNSTLIKYDGITFNVIRCLYDAGTTGARSIRRMLVDYDRILLGCERGLFSWDELHECQQLETGVFPVSSNEIDNILLRNNGTILLLHEESLVEVDGETITPLDIASYLPGGPSTVARLAMKETIEDEEGALWVNLEYTYQKKYFLARRSPITRAWQFFSEDVLPFDREITSLLSKESKLYMATSLGLYIWDFAANSWNIYNEENSPYWNYGAIKMKLDPDENLWMINNRINMENNRSNRLLKFDGQNWETLLVENTYVSSFAFTSDRTLWVASGNFNPPYFTQHLRTYKNGMWGLLSPITYVLNADNAYTSNLIAGPDENLILASNEGVYRFDYEGNVLNHYTTCTSGLVGDQTNDISLDPIRQELWIATEDGLAKFSPATEIIEPSFEIPSDICVGIPTRLTSSTLGAISYEWRVAGNIIGTGAQVTYTFSEVGEHIVELIAINGQGCGTSASKSLSVHPVATFENLPTEIIECDAFQEVCAPEGMASYRWTRGSLFVSDQPCLYLDQNDSGIYELEITDHCGNIARESTSISLSGTCVWPGDINNDGTVNFIDMLWLGYTFGYSGPARAEQGINWRQYPALDWNAYLPTGTNFSYSDSDGSGTCDLLDAEAINLNYLNSRGIAPGLPIPEQSPYAFEPVLVGVDTTLGEGLYRIAIDILARGTTEGGIDNFYGAGMRIYFNLPPGVQLTQAPEFTFNNSSIGTEGLDAIGLVKPFLDQGFMDVAFTRIDHRNQSAVDTLGRAYFIAADDHLPIFDSLQLNLSLVGATAITNQGDFIPVDGAERTFNFSNEELTSTQSILTDSNISVYPNPTTGKCLLELPHWFAQKVTIQVFSTHGTEVMATATSGQTFLHEIDLSALPPGLYWLVICHDDRRSIRKIIKQ